MPAAMQVAQSIEPLQSEAQTDQQPDQEQAALVVMADLLQSIAVLGIIEALVFYLPAAFGHGVEATAARATRGKIGEPVGLDDLTVGMVLTITDHRQLELRLPMVKQESTSHALSVLFNRWTLIQL